MSLREDAPRTEARRDGRDERERPDPPVPVRLPLDHGCDAPGLDDADLYGWAAPRSRPA